MLQYYQGNPYQWNEVEIEDEHSLYKIEQELEINGKRGNTLSYEPDFEVNQQTHTPSDLKSLVEKNPILTVYKPILEEENVYEINKLNNQINNAVIYLQDSQFIVLEKNRPAIPGRYAIKHLITKTQTIQIIRIPYFNAQNENAYSMHTNLIQSIATLYYYLEEAYEKQLQGAINNALFLIQQPILQKYNNFSSACWLHCLNQPNDTRLKFVFINLSDDESAENLRLWSDYINDQKTFHYFSILNLGNNDDLEKLFKEKYSNCIEIIPYKIQTKILTMRLLSILINDFLYAKIERLNPENIALNIKFSELQQYEPEALQLLISTLSKLSFNKLLIYLQFDQNAFKKNDFEQEQVSIKTEKEEKQYQMIVNAINICYYSFQRRKIKMKEDLQGIQSVKFYIDLKRMAEVYKNMMQEKLAQSLQLRCNIFRLSIQKTLNSFTQQNEDLLNSIRNMFSLIFYKQGNRLIIISAQLEDQDAMDQNTQIIVSYGEKLIIVNQQPSELNDKRFLYIFDVTKALSEKGVTQKHKFQKIPLPIECIYRYEIYLQQRKLYLIYGKLENQFFDAIYCIDLSQRQLQWNLLKRQQYQYSKEKLVFASKSEKKEYTQNANFQKIQEHREGFSICCFSSDQNEIILLLFGGEAVMQSQIMNVIEQISITQEGFISFIYEKEVVFKKQSIKPSRYQAILSDITIADKPYYLFLPYNENLSKNKFNQPISLIHQKSAILLKIQKSEPIWSNCKINYCNKEYYPIDAIQNLNNNVELLDQNEKFIIWKIIFTMAYKKQDFISLKPDYSYQLITSSNFNKTKSVKADLYKTNDFFKATNIWTDQTALIQQEYSTFYLNPTITQKIAQDDQIQVIAIENYLKLDLEKNEIFIKQLSYEMESAITINQETIAQSLLEYENLSPEKKVQKMKQ